MSSDAVRGAVLVAEDDDALRQALARIIAAAGFDVHAVSNGDEAMDAFGHRDFDLVLTDIDMPGMNGIELLRAIRGRDLDIPVVMMTAAPRLDTAISAVEYGASHYLPKPVDVQPLLQTVRRAVHAGSLARARRRLAEIAGSGAMQIADLAGLGARFDNALARIFVLGQPIVRWSGRSTFAYEALVRSAEPMIALPEALFDAADRLDRVVDVGRRVRTICGAFPHDRADSLLFVNLHARELLDDSLYERDGPLGRIAQGVVLEITERARLETVSDIADRVARLRSMGFRIAIDDLGAGYAGLTSFAALEPDFVKLDRALIEGIDRSETKRRLVGAMIRVCTDLGVHVIGEGVETAAERDTLIDLGCDLLQGFLFARPETPFPAATF